MCNNRHQELGRVDSFPQNNKAEHLFLPTLLPMNQFVELSLLLNFLIVLEPIVLHYMKQMYIK
jgi:hypothetical protein